VKDRASYEVGCPKKKTARLHQSEQRAVGNLAGGMSMVFSGWNHLEQKAVGREVEWSSLDWSIHGEGRVIGKRGDILGSFMRR